MKVGRGYEDFTNGSWRVKTRQGLNSSNLDKERRLEGQSHFKTKDRQVTKRTVEGFKRLQRRDDNERDERKKEDPKRYKLNKMR